MVQSFCKLKIMSTNKNLNDIKKKPDDEYYTNPDLVNAIMGGTHKKLTEMYPGKKIHYIFAADGDQSKFVKFGKDNNLNFDYGMRFEEFPKYINDDPNTIHMVVTNPPFSKMNDFLNPKTHPDIDKALHNPNVHHGFINHQTDMFSENTLPYAKKDHVYAIKGKLAWYDHLQPDQKTTKPAKLDNTVYFSDLDIDWPNKDDHYKGVKPGKAWRERDGSIISPPNWIAHKEYMTANGYNFERDLRMSDPKTKHQLFRRLLWLPNYSHPNYDPNKDLTKPVSSGNLEIVSHPKKPKKSKNYVVSLDTPEDNNN